MQTLHEKTTAPGITRWVLDLGQLYPGGTVRSQFEARYEQFMAAAPEHRDLFSLERDRLLYLSESFVNFSPDGRPAVLLVLGNPASHSVHAGMCFAFEQPNCREHRFWQGLRDSGWLAFTDEATGSDASDRNESRRAALLDGAYESPFRIGIDMFFSFPSPATHREWGGVAGLRKLFGGEALAVIARTERSRLARTIADFNKGEGAVVAFQKDAYEGLRGPEATPYSRLAASKEELSGRTAAGEPIWLFGAPPTRLARSAAFGAVLCRIREAILAMGAAGAPCGDDRPH